MLVAWDEQVQQEEGNEDEEPEEAEDMKELGFDTLVIVGRSKTGKPKYGMRFCQIGWWSDA
jgi:hypothetical protein